MSSDQDNSQFVPDNEAVEAQQSGINAEQEDQAVASSEETGQVSQQEVEGLKDSIGGGEVLDDSEGYTRSSNKDAHPMQGEQELDSKIDSLE